MQLIHAGKDASLREKTYALGHQRFDGKGFIEKGRRPSSREAYVFFSRTLEHRIQLIEGNQTHSIPAEEHELYRLARMMGFRDTPIKRPVDIFGIDTGLLPPGCTPYCRSLFYKPPDQRGISDDLLALFSPDMPDHDAIQTLSGRALGCQGRACQRQTPKEGPGLTRLSSRSMLYLQKLAPVFLARR